MNRVRLLPEQVANQIAAGEVVERPASVIKELVENSLDAGARHISVEIVGAGRGLIRIIDDGSGMSRDDALLCLERHATSKIASAADLSRVTTMGFRGEAVPSIASVSRFILTTREQGLDPSVAAVRVVIHGGKILEVREAGGTSGTTVEVRNLFYNVPARRKFLRSDETERAHIQHWLTTAALAHPGVAFTLTMEGRVVWQLPALPFDPMQVESQLKALRERLRWLVGDGVSLVPVTATGELASSRIAPADPASDPEISPPLPVRLFGWIGAPGVSRASREDQHLFVNRRPIDNRGLNAALIEGYHNALMKGRYPLACLFLEIDPAEVDVNIHPAKREVKFHRERSVRLFVAESVRQALRSWHDPQSTSPSEPGAVSKDIRTTPASSGVVASLPLAIPQPVQSDWVSPAVAKSLSAPLSLPPNVATPPAPTPPSSTSIRVNPDPGSGDGRIALPTAPQVPPVSPGDPMPTSAAVHAVPGLPNPPVAVDIAAPSSPRGGAGPAGAPVPLLSVPLRLVGVVGRLYVVLESDRGLVLLDQHAAHERVLYEQMLRRMEQGEMAPSQRLLLPETIELSPKDAAFLRENLPALSRLGVGLSEFGERTFLLDALPPFVKSASPRRFALELVDELRAAGAGVNSWRLGEAVVAKTVCRHSVKANDPLADQELLALIESLRQCDMPYTCPHGRPTLIEMSFRELEKRFGRVQG
ncbi:MAG: DNA mismatch repair endonuclease MutL [Verrucomicrobiales bacterium]|nr:DNA mismatch repair endonuclease MutL [Verrucomicrobiales bacterium]